MPIRKDLRHFYGKVWKTVTRPRILKRAGNQCEQCGVPNYTDVRRVGGAWLSVVVSWAHGAVKTWMSPKAAVLFSKPPGRLRKVRIVLTVAHLNHVAGDDRDENLRALCQWCHLNFDMVHHRETRQLRKDAARPLLVSDGLDYTIDCACPGLEEQLRGAAAAASAFKKVFGGEA